MIYYHPLGSALEAREHVPKGHLGAPQGAQGYIDISHDYRLYCSTTRPRTSSRHFKIRELVEEAAIRVKYVASESNIADIFTKCLSPKKFEELRNKLLNMVRVD